MRDKSIANSSFFEQIDSPEKAYWLGFIAADGSVDDRNARIRVGLQEKDYGHLCVLRDNIAPQAEVRFRTVKGYTRCELVFKSARMVRSLVVFGVVRNKTNRYRWPETLPNDFAIPFILGYFDGDGSLCLTLHHSTKRWRWSLCGTYDFLSA
ncbi:MAG: hypothetical protein M3R61_14725, partial [Chloroflexota bacterium]|nr:hypothetical protein [Chloroflexota bacterium]